MLWTYSVPDSTSLVQSINHFTHSFCPEYVEIVLSEPFSGLKIFCMLQENLAVSNLMFSSVFLVFLVVSFQFSQWILILNPEILSFLVNEERSSREPEKLKISGWSIKVNWEKCKGTTKNKRKTEDKLRLLTALFYWSIQNNF